MFGCMTLNGKGRYGKEQGAGISGSHFAFDVRVRRMVFRAERARVHARLGRPFCGKAQKDIRRCEFVSDTLFLLIFPCTCLHEYGYLCPCKCTTIHRNWFLRKIYSLKKKHFSRLELRFLRLLGVRVLFSNSSLVNSGNRFLIPLFIRSTFFEAPLKK